MSLDAFDFHTGGLTANSEDHEWVQLLLAVFALAWEVGHGLNLPVEQIVQQCQSHFLWCAAVWGDMDHVSWRHWAANAHLRVVFIPQPGACWVILWRTQKKQTITQTALVQQTSYTIAHPCGNWGELGKSRTNLCFSGAEYAVWLFSFSVC